MVLIMSGQLAREGTVALRANQTHCRLPTTRVVCANRTERADDGQDKSGMCAMTNLTCDPFVTKDLSTEARDR